MGRRLVREWVVVTGASRGVGRATAIEAARRGHDVALLARDSQRLRATQKIAEGSAKTNKVIAIETDLQDIHAIEAAGKKILELGTPKALINNAGVIDRQGLLELSLDSWRRQLDVNLTASVWMAKQLLPAMLERKGGSIVNVSSISGSLGSARQIAYNASKWAVIGFTKSLAEELKDSGVMTCTVLPGSIDTDMLRGSGYAPRMTAQDVAETLLYYALDAPPAHNGAAIEMFGT